MGHGRPVEDFAGILQVGDLLFREGVSQDIFRRRLLIVPVISGDAVSGMDTRPADGQTDNWAGISCWDPAPYASRR